MLDWKSEIGWIAVQLMWARLPQGDGHSRYRPLLGTWLKRLIGREARVRRRYSARPLSAKKRHSHAPLFGRSGVGSTQQAVIQFAMLNVASLAIAPLQVEGP
ncbi:MULTISPECIES: hypothetical protein [Cupriavidus]|uniref:hypothetical protein n=1 Tax=Cupriavidus sp. DF5525 TaxID=3160989 RepID=UPI0032DF292A